MHLTKHTHLRTQIQTHLRQDNLEKCFELLRSGYNLSAEKQAELNLLENRWNRAKRSHKSGDLLYGEYNREVLHVAAVIGDILEKLGEEDVSAAGTVNDRILIVACPDRPEDFWQTLFPEIWFSHRKIIKYREDIPEDFRAADVVIFDDLRGQHCKGPSREVFMREIARALPDANLLYFGDENPFYKSDYPGDLEIFERMGNANSRFTIHARLRELLEFRKIFGKTT